MASQRDAIRMSKEEVEAFLDSSKTLVLATLDRQGAPHLTALWFARRGETVMFETYGASQKVMNLRRDTRLAILCEQGESYDQLRGVSITGRAEVVDRGSRLEECMAIIINRNTPGLTPETLAGHVATMIRKRIVVIVHAEKVISWDHRKLRRSSAAPSGLVP
jgi:PPOX class probable F420-dependent enzyme